MITPRIPNEPFLKWLQRFQLMNDGNRPLYDDLTPAGFPRIFFKSGYDIQEQIQEWMAENNFDQTGELTLFWKNARLILSSDSEMIMFKLRFSDVIEIS